MTAEEYEDMKNGLKPDILNKYPIADLFAPAMDSVLRNGIGHNAARYDGESDQIVYTVQVRARFEWRTQRSSPVSWKRTRHSSWPPSTSTCCTVWSEVS